MTERERVIRAIECCLKNDHNQCGYESTLNHVTGETCMTKLLQDVLGLLRNEATTDRTWHKWPDEKPEDFIDSSVPKGMLEWKVLCLTVSRNNKVFMQYRRRSVFPSGPYWAACEPKYWMIIPKFEQEESLS